MYLSEKSESCPSVSIVIVNFNGREFLKQCLLTLLNTNYPNYDIVVVDVITSKKQTAKALALKINFLFFNFSIDFTPTEIFFSRTP